MNEKTRREQRRYRTDDGTEGRQIGIKIKVKNHGSGRESEAGRHGVQTSQKLERSERTLLSLLLLAVFFLLLIRPGTGSSRWVIDGASKTSLLKTTRQSRTWFEGEGLPNTRSRVLSPKNQHHRARYPPPPSPSHPALLHLLVQSFLSHSFFVTHGSSRAR